MRGTTLKGAELFGVDSYGQIFMGTCSHLLVLKALPGADSIFRYYNKNDIPRVLQALNANAQHTTLYMEICKGIMQYWKIPGNVSFPDGPERENTGSCVTEFSSEDASISNFSKEPMHNETLGAVSQPDSICYQVIPSEQTQQDDTKLVEIATCTSRSSSNSVEQVNKLCWSAVSLECEKACGRLQQNRIKKPTYDRRKLSANVLLQGKAFSSAATRFFWPNTEKKVVEVPRERCSWCLNCKAAVTGKKGCLLNAAVSNAIKGAVKILAGLVPASVEEGNLRGGIATYYIDEESLTGPDSCPFQFEENIRFVVFSGDWFKLVDGGASESSITHSTAGAVESSHKHKPGRRAGNHCQWYLDMHVRWSDLVSPEQQSPEEKNQSEASSFRNASICHKRIVGNEKRDGNDKHCCASCEVDVLLRNAVKCNTCQGLWPLNSVQLVQQLLLMRKLSL
ncbi:hypothetical protein HAX54_052259 [Datura stramonium]|uniref:Uncharacterized protein n=1 Tax=Datura stramonium TaxID=4076 RepID=A0ABS8SYQ1_DATST|nr:hypothetical protein [Datura stramonium]